MHHQKTAALLSRRVLLLGFGGLGLGAAVSAHPALAQAQAYNRVTADVTPLREKGLGRYAAFVGSELDRALQSAFAGRTGRRGVPDLVARIQSIQLASLPDGDGFRFGGGGASDCMDGEALVVLRGRVLKQHPQLLSFPSHTGGAWYDTDNEMKRTAALCAGYASWLARAV